MLDIEEGTPVRIYWNLHRGCYSVQVKQWPKIAGASYWSVDQTKPKRWLLWGHCMHVDINEPRFKVSKAGNKRVREEGKKNVHAFVKGTWTKGWNPYPQDWVPVHYNPYKYTDFMLGQNVEHRVPIHEARHATLNEYGQMWASA